MQSSQPAVRGPWRRRPGMACQRGGRQSSRRPQPGASSAAPELPWHCRSRRTASAAKRESRCPLPTGPAAETSTRRPLRAEAPRDQLCPSSPGRARWREFQIRECCGGWAARPDGFRQCPGGRVRQKLIFGQQLPARAADRWERQMRKQPRCASRQTSMGPWGTPEVSLVKPSAGGSTLAEGALRSFRSVRTSVRMERVGGWESSLSN